MQEFENIINKYFVDKKIGAIVVNKNITDNYISFVIALTDIDKLKKFDKKMEQELTYLLGTSISINVGKNITIIVNSKAIRKSKETVIKANKGMTIPIGTDVYGNTVYLDFINNPHWLIGGSTGSGKSVFLNNIIKKLVEIYHFDVEFCFIDLKKVEFHKYNKLEMNLVDVAENINSALTMLNDVIEVMNNRYSKYKSNNCISFEEYNSNKADGEKDRYLVLVIDELAELMLLDKKNIQPKIQRLLQLGRAAGIYVIGATQRPSREVLSGTLKVNFTTRICFKVASAYDSKTIINVKGGENLYGKGDALLLKSGSDELIRFQAYPPTSDDIIDKYRKTDQSFMQKNIINPLKKEFEKSSIGKIVKKIFK